MILNSEGLPAGVRRERIAGLVADRGFVHVGHLADEFGVSRVTVRTDLDALASQGRLRRVRGGALDSRQPDGVPSDRTSDPMESPLQDSKDDFLTEKILIGHAAAQLVSSGESIILDGGTTTMAVAHSLVKRADLHDVVIFTNSLPIALGLECAIPRFTIFVTGGSLRPLQHSLVNPLATKILTEIHVDTAFLACSGVHSKDGFTDRNLPEVEIKQMMIRSASRRVFVAAGSKLGHKDLATICQLTEADLLLTGGSADNRIVEECRRAGLDLQICG
ncbi:DeoR/GlpR family DNA-binding transcription regulator [Nonomuraea sp. NPDC049714]|uniref:DeoR/GlpR family DNA-binding transcription regulator n=1 Tax=Nonomuraea sp. NPDC049714 TaxID=3364357 RepID=UPI0037BA66AF